MPKVELQENESFDVLFKRFKNAIAKSGILQDVKKKVYYQKPSERRKAKMIAARKKRRS